MCGQRQVLLRQAKGNRKERRERDQHATRKRRERERRDTRLIPLNNNQRDKERASTNALWRERERERLHSPARTITALQARTAVAGVAAALLRL